MSREDFEESKPFKALHIRVRDQIVSDGFNPSDSLDWSSSGREMRLVVLVSIYSDYIVYYSYIYVY